MALKSSASANVWINHFGSLCYTFPGIFASVRCAHLSYRPNPVTQNHGCMSKGFQTQGNQQFAWLHSSSLLSTPLMCIGTRVCQQECGAHTDAVALIVWSQAPLLWHDRPQGAPAARCVPCLCAQAKLQQLLDNPDARGRTPLWIACYCNNEEATAICAREVRCVMRYWAARLPNARDLPRKCRLLAVQGHIWQAAMRVWLISSWVHLCLSCLHAVGLCAAHKGTSAAALPASATASARGPLFIFKREHFECKSTLNSSA